MKYLPNYLIVTTVITEDNEKVEVVYGARDTRKEACLQIAKLNKEAGYAKYRLQIHR